MFSMALTDGSWLTVHPLHCGLVGGGIFSCYETKAHVTKAQDQARHTTNSIKSDSGGKTQAKLGCQGRESHRAEAPESELALKWP